MAQIVIDGASGQKILDEELKDYKIKNVILPTVKEIIVANALWEQGIYQKISAMLDNHLYQKWLLTAISVILVQMVVLVIALILTIWIFL